MIKRILSAFIFLSTLVFAQPVLATTYYADTVAHGAGGTTCSIGAPCTVLYMSGTKLTAGDTGIVKDGTYTETGGVIFCNDHSGTDDTHMITIRPETDGGVWINGQGSRTPMQLIKCSWWDISGFNFSDSNQDSVGYLMMTYPVGQGDPDNYGSNHNYLHRLVFWNAADVNSTGLLVWSSENNVIEDVAAFGTFRKAFQSFNRANNNIYRRTWDQWTFSSVPSQPYGPFSLSYDSSNNLAENCISTWDQDPGTVVSADLAFGLISINQYDRANSDGIAANHTTNSEFTGCIVYQLAGMSGTFLGTIQGGQAADGITYNNIISYLANTSMTSSCSNLDANGNEHLTWCNQAMQNLDNNAAINQAWGGPSMGHHILQNITAVRTVTGGQLTSIGSDWTQTNMVSGTSISAATGDGAAGCYTGTHGGKVRYQYNTASPPVYGSPTLTSVPLWPWPMTQRIITAMNLAGRTPRNVDNDIQSICGVSPDINPSGNPPIDTMSSYTVTTNVDTQNGGTSGWNGGYSCSTPTAMTFQTSPGGSSGTKVIRSQAATGGDYCYRLMNNVTFGTFTIGMQTSISNPTETTNYGFTLNEAGVSDRINIRFSSSGTVDARDFLTASWIPVCTYTASSEFTRVEIDIDTAAHPNQYRARCKSTGTSTSWIGTHGTLSIINLISLNDFETIAHTLYYDGIGSTSELTTASPMVCAQSSTCAITLTGLRTNWANGTTACVANPATNITVNSTNVGYTTSITWSVSPSAGAALTARDIVCSTGNEGETLPAGLTITGVVVNHTVVGRKLRIKVR